MDPLWRSPFDEDGIPRRNLHWKRNAASTAYNVIFFAIFIGLGFPHPCNSIFWNAIYFLLVAVATLIYLIPVWVIHRYPIPSKPKWPQYIALLAASLQVTQASRFAMAWYEQHNSPKWINARYGLDGSALPFVYMLAYKVSNWIILDHLSTYNEAYEPVSINDVLGSMFTGIIDSHGKFSYGRVDVKQMSIEKASDHE